ncbi:SH3 domain-containing protein [Leptospira wolffii]|uniref:SH3 domain-containing protein n=1 Tax=Leptospira wolffii TaxID=409998 RepID=UPI0002D8DCC2|nr:SH3 domain-containing protein [Leptospira wolffii]EPG66205.1 hypothetical protein LEP1GSC061_4071 [Leptospira wolffii serovar Khorat str. Khorat-H2]
MGKRSVYVLFFSVLLFGGCRSQETGELVLTGESTLRFRPDFSSKGNEKLATGEKVVIQEKGDLVSTRSGKFQWFRVLTKDGSEGWIFGANAKSVEDYFGKKSREWRLVKSLRLYDKEGSSDKAQEADDELAAGTILRELDRKERWIKVENPSGREPKEGWVHTLNLTTQEHWAKLDEESQPCFQLKKFAGFWYNAEEELYICSPGEGLANQFEDARSEIHGFDNLKQTKRGFEMDGMMFTDYDEGSSPPEYKIQLISLGPLKLRYILNGQPREYVKNIPTSVVSNDLKFRWKGSNDRFPEVELNLCKKNFAKDEDSKNSPRSFDTLHILRNRKDYYDKKIDIIFIPEIAEAFRYDPESDTIEWSKVVDAPRLVKLSCD